MKRFVLLAATLPLAASAAAQEPALVQRAAPLRDAGILRLADGTWTRRPGAQAYGSVEALFRNDAAANYYSVQPEGLSITDEGRIPGTGSEGDHDVYSVHSFDMAYCTGQANPLSAMLTFYEAYAPCSAPSAPLASIVAAGLPGGGSSAGLACWLVTVDLAGSTQSFSIGADGGDGYDGDPTLDSFGWTFELTGHGSDPLTGPLRAGDPLNAPYGAGTRSAWGFPAGPGTGLGEEDRFWLDAAAGGASCVQGNYPTAPFGGLFLVIAGEPADGNLLTSYPCPTAPNSTGSPALISATGSASMADASFLLRAAPVPNQPGIFFHGTQQVQLPFGNGVRCAGGTVKRLPAVMAIANVLQQEASSLLAQSGAIGQTIHLQAWYRDPAGGGFAFNLSDAGLVTILP